MIEEPKYLTIRETNLMIYQAWIKGQQKKREQSKKKENDDGNGK